MIALASTVHDEHGGLRWLLRLHGDEIVRRFGRVVLVATPQTDARLLGDAERLGFSVTRLRKNVVGETYFQAAKRGSDTGAETVFLCDFDRVLHWLHAHPREFDRALAAARRQDYAIFERSPRAYRSHHDALYWTEQAPNFLLSTALGNATFHDHLSGCMAFSRRAARVIASHGRTRSYDLFSRWPLLLRATKISPTYIRCEGLEWETPDRFRAAVKRAGGVRQWRKRASSPAEWRKRARMAEEFVKWLR